jgi:glycerol-3-phosphate dehydrogenase
MSCCEQGSFDLKVDVAHDQRGIERESNMRKNLSIVLTAVAVLGGSITGPSLAKEITAVRTADVAPISVPEPSFKELDARLKQYQKQPPFRIIITEGVTLGRGDALPTRSQLFSEEHNRSTFGLLIKQKF